MILLVFIELYIQSNNLNFRIFFGQPKKKGALEENVLEFPKPIFPVNDAVELLLLYLLAFEESVRMDNKGWVSLGTIHSKTN